MGRLDDISLEELQELREQTEGEIPRERVLAAIDRKQGDEIKTLAERHGVVEKTIRNWLDRFAEEPIEQAPYDAPRPGGPSKLTAEEREQLDRLLHVRDQFARQGEERHVRAGWDKPGVNHGQIRDTSGLYRG